MSEWYKDPDTLWSYLQEHKNEIYYVQLVWTWPEYIETDTPYCFRNKTDGYPQPLYARWSATRIDEEYTFIGPIEDAIKYAESYDCWSKDKLEEDGHIIDGVLICENEGYDPDGYQFPNKDPADRDLFNLTYDGLYYYKRDHNGNSVTQSYDIYHKEPPLTWSDITKGE